MAGINLGSSWLVDSWVVKVDLILDIGWSQDRFKFNVGLNGDEQEMHQKDPV